MIDLVLDRALLLREGRLHLGQVLAARWLTTGMGLEVVEDSGFDWCSPAAISDSTRALKPFLASAMSSVRTSCQLEKSAGEMETAV